MKFKVIATDPHGVNKAIGVEAKSEAIVWKSMMERGYSVSSVTQVDSGSQVSNQESRQTQEAHPPSLTQPITSTQKFYLNKNVIAVAGVIGITVVLAVLVHALLRPAAPVPQTEGIPVTPQMAGVQDADAAPKSAIQKTVTAPAQEATNNKSVVHKAETNKAEVGPSSAAQKPVPEPEQETTNIKAVVNPAKTPSAEEGAKVKERIDIDPVLQGVWRIVMNKDGSQSNLALARVSASRVTMMDGKVFNTSKVLMTKTDEGRNAAIIHFSDMDRIWAISETGGGDGVFLMQTFTSEFKETYRCLIKVD